MNALAESCRLHTPVIPDLTIGLLTLTKKTMRKLILQKKNIDSMIQYEKIKVESLKKNILQNLRNNIKEIIDSEFTIFKTK